MLKAAERPLFPFAFYRVIQCKASQIRCGYLGGLLTQLQLFPFLRIMLLYPFRSLSWYIEVWSILRINGKWFDRITKGEPPHKCHVWKGTFFSTQAKYSFFFSFSGRAQKMMFKVCEKCHKKWQTIKCATAVNNSNRNQLHNFHVGVSKEKENE